MRLALEQLDLPKTCRLGTETPHLIYTRVENSCTDIHPFPAVKLWHLLDAAMRSHWVSNREKLRIKVWQMYFSLQPDVNRFS
jgi:hypothetical protein